MCGCVDMVRLSIPTIHLGVSSGQDSGLECESSEDEYVSLV